MTTPASSNGRRGVHYTAAAAVLLLLAGIVIAALGFRSASPGPTASTRAATPTPQSPRPAERHHAKDTVKASRPDDRPDFGTVLKGSAPVELKIPAIDLRATSLVGLGLADNGEIEVPQDADNPGWFTPGPTPGQLGPAVIAGHVDSRTGPAVFYRLGELHPGDRVQVVRHNGSVARFRIDRVASFKKDAFPTRAVYGPTTRAELRLITCGGQYDDQSGYLNNTVVFAHLV
jgi:hypothetical protein